MSLGTIITIVLYAVLALSLLIGFLIGFKRGLVKSSIRFGIFAGLIIVAGFISGPIANAISKINISGLNLVVDGAVVQTLPEALKSLIFSNSLMENLATSSPSMVKLVENLPGAILSFVVFFLLVLIMSLLSYFVYLIIAKTCLKESKLKKQIKKKKKSTKYITQEKFLEERELENLKKRKKGWFGGAVGLVNGFVFLFALLLPITSLISTVSDITTQTENVVYAEESGEDEGEFLSETSGDLIKYFLGEEIVDALNGYGNSIPGKILTVGGLDDVVFDSITKIKINDTNFKFREEISSIAKIYDQCVYLVDEIGKAEDYTSVDFEKVNKILDTLFETSLVKSLAPELLPYAMDYFYSTELFESLDYKEEIKIILDLVIEDVKTNPNGFVKTLRNELNPIINIVQVACETGYVDDLMGGKREISDLMVALKRNEFTLLNSVTENLFESEILRNILPNATNTIFNSVESAVSDINFAEISTENLNWEFFESDVNNILKNTVECYLILHANNAIDDIESIAKKDFDDNSFKAIMYLVGNELQLVKENELFKKQSENPYTTIVNYLSTNEDIQLFFSAEKLNNVNWNVEFFHIVPSLTSLKNSGVLEHIISSEEPNGDLVCDLLVELENEKTYLETTVSGLYDSSVFKKPLTVFINEFIHVIGEALSDEGEKISFKDIEESNLTMPEKASIISVLENVMKSYKVLNNENFDLENLTNNEIESIGSLLNSLKENSFKYENGVPNPECVVSQDGTTVENGGIFAQVYVEMVDYAKKSYSFEGDVSIGTIEWVSFLKTAKKLSEIEADQFLEILTGKDEDINVGEVLEVLGATEETVESIKDIALDIENLNPESPKSFDDLANSLKDLDEEKIEDIVNRVNESTGEEISIDTSIIEKEKNVSSTISTLIDNGLTNGNLEKSLENLCNGATVVLSQALSKGVKILKVEIDGGLEALETKIEQQTNNLTIQNLVKQLFGI